MYVKKSQSILSFIQFFFKDQQKGAFISYLATFQRLGQKLLIRLTF